MIDNANHFSIILNASDLIGLWLQKTGRQKTLE
jgi:hypothetical protein